MQRPPDDLRRRLAAVHAQMQAAALRAGRSVASVRLVAVTKGVAAERIAPALALGVTDVGESRVQEALPKIASLGAAARWHLVGHLQRNKVRRAVDVFALIHSIDSVALAEEVARRGAAGGRVVDVLLQVNVAGVGRQHGLRPEDVPGTARRVVALEGIRVRGLMTIAPPTADPEMVRPVFRRLRELGTAVRAWIPEADELSMGMSNDFAVAIEEGATLVRVGRAIFGERRAPGRSPRDSGEHSTRERRGEREG